MWAWAAEEAATGGILSQGPVVVAIIGVVSVIAGAATPELVKMLKPPVTVTPPAPAAPVLTVSPQAFEKLVDRIQEVAVRQGTLAGEFGSLRHELTAVRRVMDDRDRQHMNELEGIRDGLQHHRWAEHGIPTPGHSTMPVPRSPLPGPPVEPVTLPPLP